MSKRVYKYIITFILIFAIFSSNIVSAFQISGFQLNAKAAMLISLDTDQILHEKNADKKMYPASLTKMLAAVLVLEQVDDIDKTTITVSKSALTAIMGTGASVIGLKEGEVLTVRQALYCLLVSSGGDVAYVIAEYIGGNTENFMDMMNKRAKELGMEHSSFGNPVGLHDDKTYTTARDISILAKHALKFDVFKEITSTTRYYMPKTNKSPQRILSTTNFLIDPSTNYYYAYASGVKTGFTDEAGRCVVSTASYNGYNYLCIIMGCDGTGGQRNEFVDSRNLYRWAFNDFEYKELLDISKPVTEIPLELSMETDYLKLYPSNNITQILPKTADSSTITIKPHLKHESVDAPIKKGDVLGTADVIYAGEIIGTVKLVSNEDIKANVFLQSGRVIKNIFTSSIFKIILIVIVGAIVIYVLICVYLTYKSRKKRRKVKYIPYNKHGKDE
ncbi:MAG: D-alanyl-D-alanine carboxypeptidase [Clostridia bacterium]|nr:D-alanyl-D-alanine carboxypeptidase [Clostridia bacterium]